MRKTRLTALVLVLAIVISLIFPYTNSLSEELKPKTYKLKTKKLTLDECIDIAMENHPPLEIAKKQLDLAQFRVMEAKRNLGPKVTAKWEISKGVVSQKNYNGEKIQIEGKQPIFYGGELIFSVKQAQVNLEIVRNDYERIKNDLIVEVKKGYYSLDKAKKALKVQKKLNKRTGELYKITKIGYEANVIPQVEFLKVSSQHNQTEFAVISATQDIEIANLLIQQAMNINAEIAIGDLEEPRIIEFDMEDCYILAYLNRPEIRIGHLSVQHFEYETKIMNARANWPRVDILGMYGNMREDFIPSNLPKNQTPRGLGPEYYFGTIIKVPFWGNTVEYSYTNEKWQPVVRTVHETKSETHLATFNLLDRLEDIASVKEKHIEQMRSQKELIEKKQEITMEIKETYYKYKKAIILIDVSESKIGFQSKQVEVLEVRRSLGEAKYSDVIEELIKLAEEEFAYLQAIADYYTAIALLNKAIGISDYFRV